VDRRRFVLAATSFVLKRKDWRDQLAEVEAGEPSA
jgi:hypothetical protein